VPHLLPPERIVELLDQAGLLVSARMMQEPGEGRQRQIATLIAQKER
jgi:hypothetical protein